MIKANWGKTRGCLRVVAPGLLTVIVVTGCGKTEDKSQSINHKADKAFIGMCFNDASPDDTQITESANAVISNIALDSVSCQAPHDNEIYYIHSLPEAVKDRLDTEDFFEDMLDVCEAQFESYIGTGYQQSFYEMSVLFPTPESWDKGHKQAICYAFHPQAEKLDYGLKAIKK